MRFFPQRMLSSIILIVSLAVILAVLAVLQYRWSGQVSEAEHERMHTSLLASMNQFRLQLHGEFRQLGFLLQPDASVLMHRDWKSYAASCDVALSGSSVRLIRSIYLWVAEANGRSQLLELNRNAKAFEVVPWPAGFERVRDRYGRLFSSPMRPDPETRPFAWTMLNRIPLMLQTLVVSELAPAPSRARMQFVGCLMIELNSETIRTELLAELAKKYFEGSDGFIYQVAVVSGRDPGAIVYQSDPHLTIEAFAQPDARMSLMENPFERFRPMGLRPRRSPEPPDGASPDPPEAQFRPEPPSPRGAGGMEPGAPDDEDFGWTLVAKHREGSLETAVAGLRRRNLALSFGSLLLLAASMALITVSARRAQRLARLQIDFVAGISHELRTPLAVICSAGDNLAEGVIADSSRSARKYGELIRSEGRKLAGMIEQILQFAGAQRGHRPYNLRSARPNDIADAALDQAQPMIEAAGFSVEKCLAPDLPRVNVDAAALSRAIQNLIQNALKYSGESRWLAIRTVKTGAKRGAEVQIIVEDKGMGIGSEDLPHIFEPFYRGDATAAAQIHGTGLGLFMVREALVSMGGNISAKSAPGEGSTFTIHLPALPAPDDISFSAAGEEHSDHAIQDIVDRR